MALAGTAFSYFMAALVVFMAFALYALLGLLDALLLQFGSIMYLPIAGAPRLRKPVVSACLRACVPACLRACMRVTNGGGRRALPAAI